ncbi:MAG: tRNA uridine-5-carboxymethylaminomethyl(34) synthesis GTPase MnmE [Archangiaceae bacterium]|nr:tRNA uridine-5-carboxymethylaminomethyl(34) synthesis GTPase MnmE [Archangiaceae bacterium]
MTSAPSSSTIAAIATGPAAGGVGVIRISGPAALEAARRVVPGLPLFPAPRHAYLASIAGLDDGLVIHFPAPNSYTGEEVVELMPHGSPKLLSMVLQRLCEHPALRLAEPGEFTRRAFVNGRIDLARAEAVADLVAAQSEAGVRSAAAQLAGALSQRIDAAKSRLVPLHADLEACLDFPDEAEGADALVAARLDAVLEDLEALAAQGAVGALARRGAHVVLYGPVNAGKSTLFNALLGTRRALVDPEPGTTRDVLEAIIELQGLQVTLVDTAGLRAGAGRVEALGIEKTREALRGADLALLVVPPDATDLGAWRSEASGEVLVIAAKSDLGRRSEGFPVSAANGQGLSDLKAELARRLGAGKAEAVALASERHRDALRRATEALQRARAALDASTLEVVAGETAVALDALDEITGQDARTELLDAIFQRFCIGK